MKRSLPTTALSVVALLAVLALACLMYLPALGFYFVADDFRYLELAARVRSLGDVFPYVRGACTHVGWPLVVLAFWIGRTLGGVQPEPYRLIALGVHLANIVLVYALVRRVAAGKPLAAVIAALVLALHPRQHESVIWLSALTWPAGTMFSLVAAYCYVAWRQTRRLWWLAFVWLAVALAMVSNPSTLVLPLVLAAYDVLQRRWDRLSVAVWGVLLLTVGMLALECGVGRLPGGGGRVSYGLDLSGITHAGVFLSYIVWPVPLNLKELLASTPVLGYAGAGLALAAVVALGLVILRRGTLLARWGVLWALLAIVPPAFFSVSLSDHYMSLMLVGVALACAGVVQGLATRWTRLVVVLALVWAVLMLPQIAVKVRNWRTASEITTAVRNETLARYPAPSSRGFFYVGLPDIVNRCVVWTYGIDSAVRLWYNNPRVYANKDVEWGVANRPAPTDHILDFSGRW